MKSFKSFLLNEVNLEWADLEKVRGGQIRGDLIYQHIKSGKNVKVKGKSKKITFADANIETMFLNKDWDGLKAFNGGAPFIDDEGNPVKLRQLDKIKAFGGGAGSGAGAALTKWVESAQCVYAQAYFNNKNTKFAKEDLQKAYSQVDVDATLEEILNIPSEWVKSSAIGAILMSKNLKNKNYIFHRGSSWVSLMSARFKDLNKKSGKPFANVNKWTPADIWAVDHSAEAKYKFDDCQSLEELNDKLIQAYKAKDVIGISLKLMTKSAKVKNINLESNYESPKYKGYSFGKRNFYGSKDSYVLMYDGGEIQFRTFGISWQGEIKGKNANQGKIGQGSINSILKRSCGVGQLDDAKQLRKLIKSNREEFIKRFYKLAYSVKATKDKFDKFDKELSNDDDNWLESKYFCTQLYGLIKNKEQKFTAGCLSYASSQSDLSAVHMKLS